MRVTHVITTLSTGGAQTALFRLVTATPDSGVVHRVVSLTDEGAFGARLIAHGIPVKCLGMRPGVPDPRAVLGLVRELRRERPDVVQSWMYHANLLAGAAAAVTHLPLVWNIRHADVDSRHGKRLTHLTNALCARLSGVLPARIVCCADSAMRSHRALGYRADRMVVIPNGFELDHFVRDPVAGAQVRQELSIAGGAPVVGLLARFHPDKDHLTLLAAARLVVARRPDAVFVLAGDGVEWSNPTLAAAIDAFGIRPQLRLLGVRRDVPALLSALDLLASSSRSEAFPQVLGEAMSCELPCVATDCGDSREIVGETGRIVGCGDGEALAGAILEIIALSPAGRAALGAAARERVRKRYDIAVMLQRYVALYQGVAARRAGASA
jgi:glycosyltransferase involved in cell wall biosynthesis